MKDPFTINKQKVRELNLVLIKRYFHSNKGRLRYLGLPASSMRDILLWKDYFSHFTAVERGRSGEEYRYQHDLILTAMNHDLSDKLRLLRGDLDDILVNGSDNFGNPVDYPFDVVSLDYSGGLIRKDEFGKSIRADSIAELVRNQAINDHNFLLFISCNMNNHDQGEARRVLGDIGHNLTKHHIDASPTIQAYLNHPMQQAQLAVYVPYLVRNLGWSTYQCEVSKPVYYLGNRSTKMMNFSFWLKRTANTVAGRPDRQTLIQLLNIKVFECIDGDVKEADFGIPRLDFN